jgi:hypothetical protein
MGDRGEKSRSFATLPSAPLKGRRMTGIGMERMEAAGAIRGVVRLRGKHEGFYHKIGENVK